MGFYRKTQSSYMGKRAAYYIQRAEVALSEADIPEIFYGKEMILQLTPDNCLVLSGAGGVHAVLDGLSDRSIQRMKALVAEGHRRYD